MIVLSELEAVLLQFFAAQPGGTRAAFITFATGLSQATVSELGVFADALGQAAFTLGYVDTATFDQVSDRAQTVGLIRATEIVRTIFQKAKFVPVGALVAEALLSQIAGVDAQIATVENDITLVNNLTPHINQLPAGVVRETGMAVQAEAIATRNTLLLKLNEHKAALQQRLATAQAG